MTIALLFIIALTSILGTIIPQNATLNFYSQSYGDFFYRLFSSLGLFNMYHSSWFRIAILMLGINITVCTSKRLPSIWKSIFTDKTKKQIKFRKFSQNIEYTSSKSTEELLLLSYSAIIRKFKKPTIRKVDSNTIIYAETGRWTKFGAQIVHLSVLLLLMGSLVSSIFGFEGYVNITEGETVDTIALKGDNKFKVLDFTIKCESFDIELYKNGVPKKYASRLSIVKNGDLVSKKEVVVNDPMRYDGISIFQSSYGKIQPKTTDIGSILNSLNDHIGIVFRIKNSGMVYEKKVKIGALIDLPENLGQFSILEYLPSVSFNEVNIGGALKCIYHSLDTDDETSIEETIILPLDYPKFDLMRGGSISFSLSSEIYDKIKRNKDHEVDMYYTGLQVTKDPGKWIVYTSFIIMIFGFVVALLMSHKEIYIKILNEVSCRKIIISGHTNRDKLAVKEIIDEIYCMIS